MSEWYIVFNGQQVGPMSKDQLAGYGLNPQSKVWKEGMADWVDAYTQPELMEIMPANKPAETVQPEAKTQPEKSNTVAGILAILLGAFGAHYFYIGKIGGAFAYMALIWGITIITCGIGAVIGVLPIVQGIMMLTMSQEEFERKYVNSTSFMPLF